MAKEITKLKEEMKAELNKLKDELKQEFKSFKESLERDFRNEIRELRQEQRNFVKSLEFAHGTIEELKTKLNTEQAANAKYVSEHEKLLERCANLERTTADLESRLVHSEQYSRNKNLEIQGVVKMEGESVAAILSKIGDAIEEPIAETDIEICHRVPSRNPGKSSIIVQFKSRAKRDTTLRKAKKKRLTNEDIGLDNTTPVYVNEHLCPAVKLLLGMAVKRKHDNHWKSVWTYNGKVFAKQTEDSDAVRISCEADLAKISSAPPAITPPAE